MRTEQRLDDINSTLRNSEKHIQAIGTGYLRPASAVMHLLFPRFMFLFPGHRRPALVSCTCCSFISCSFVLGDQECVRCSAELFWQE